MRRFVAILFAICFAVGLSYSRESGYGRESLQDDVVEYIPAKPYPPRLVNDFAGMLSASGRQLLELRVDSFARATSTQIAIVTVDTLYGMQISDYATRLFENWGIGQQGKDNGVLILAKPKTAASYGEVFICTGYGVEGVVTDAAAKRIIEKEIIPSFAVGDVYGGFDRAVRVLISLLDGEFTAEQYARKDEGGLLRDIIVIALIVAFVIFLSRRSGQNGDDENKNNRNGVRNAWPLIFFGGFGPRGGGGGFGGGGFGGFGGGNTGGGGAGGRW